MIVRYTKSQAAAIRDIRLLGDDHWTNLDMIITMINQSMEDGSYSLILLNKVVPDQVADYLKSNGNIKVVDNKQGQPAGFTLLETIDWI